MKRKDIQPLYIEALGAHEFFRQLGYLPENIFINLGRNQIAIQVKEDEKKADVVLAKEQPTDFADRWAEAVTWWNDEATEEERREIYEHSLTRNSAAKIIANLVALDMHVTPGN